jgi:hypothetical protein
LRFLHQNPVCISLRSNVCHILCPSDPPLFDQDISKGI